MHITTQESKALRHADSICFDHRADGTAAIRAIRRAENSSTGFEETVTIPVLTSRVDNYGPGDGPWTGFAMLMSARYDPAAQTIVRHLKTGATVAFHWVRDNSSPVTVAAGLVVDHLDIQIQGPRDRLADTFRVHTYIGKDNSARMIRHA